MSELQLSILVVDDNPVNQLYLKTLLIQAGHCVTIASDGQEAVSLFQRHSFDLIFMDVQMPGTDGFEAVVRIREIEAAAKPPCQRTPISALSAYPLREETHREEIVHFDYYLTKPVTKQMVKDAIERLIHPDRAYPEQAHPELKLNSDAEPGSLTHEQNTSSGTTPYPQALLHEFRNNQDDLKTMLQMALQELPESLTQLDFCFRTKELQRSCKAAHSIANVVGILHAAAERDLALRVEKLLESGNWEHARSDYLKLHQQVSELLNIYHLLLTHELSN
ncbi:MAG: response regulator [Spirochaetia bacterium]|nr:response regulator [Spirochaetia bacterium]